MIIRKICCYGCPCSLQTETFFIGFVNLFFSILALVVFRVISDNYAVDFPLYYMKKYLKGDDCFSVAIFFYLPSIYSVISSILLMIGAAEASKNFLLPWIIGAFLWLLMSTTFFFILVKAAYDSGGDAMVSFLILFFLIIAIYTYMLLAVVSYFDELVESKKEPWNKIARFSVRKNIYTVPIGV